MVKFRLSAFSDEYSASLDEQIEGLILNKVRMTEVRGVDGINVSDLTPLQAADAHRKLESAGISVSAIGSPIGKIKITDNMDEHLDKLKNTCEIAGIMQTSRIRMFSFYIPDGKYEEYRNEVIDRIGQMLDVADEYGVKLCHENEKGIYGDTDARCMNLLGAFPQMGCVFDPANFIQCGVDVLSAFDKLQSRITYMHVKDALKSTGAVVPAGCGDGQFPALLEKLAAMGQDMVLTLEPHLTVFDGLAGLQDEQLVHAFTYPDAGTAFDAAVEAVKGLL